MKTLGLIGGVSWESTTHYYQRLNQLVAARLGGWHSARLVLWNVEFDTSPACSTPMTGMRPATCWPTPRGGWSTPAPKRC